MVVFGGSHRAGLALCLACALVACQRDPGPAAASQDADVAQMGTEPAPVRATAPDDSKANEESGVADSRASAPMLEGIPTKIAAPAPDAPTPILPVGTEIAYVCENGMPLRIAFAGSVARVLWTAGTSLTLSLAASKEGGERYEGDGYVLARTANVVELSATAGSEHWRCAEATASG